MVGMLYRRLDTLDAAAAEDDARVLEDNRVGVTWSVIEDYGAVLLRDVAPGPIPWQVGAAIKLEEGASLVAVPRAVPTVVDVELVRALQADGIVPVLVVPGDAYDRVADCADGVSCAGITTLACPERLGELDQALETILLTARITRQ
jgi:hypothetical protein